MAIPAEGTRRRSRKFLLPVYLVVNELLRLGNENNENIMIQCGLSKKYDVQQTMNEGMERARVKYLLASQD